MRKNFSLSTESTIQGAQLQLFCTLEEIQHRCRIDKEICGSRVENCHFVASLHWRLFVIFGHQNENLCRACMNWIYHLLYTYDLTFPRIQLILWKGILPWIQRSSLTNQAELLRLFQSSLRLKHIYTNIEGSRLFHCSVQRIAYK